MKWFVMALLICTGSVTVQFAVNRMEDGDSFIWSGASIDGCNRFTNNTANYDGSNRCQCEQNLTFSTENNMCMSYENEGEWSYVAIARGMINV